MSFISQCSYISLKITNNVTKVCSEKRYPLNLTVGEFRAKLELITGCNYNSMTLEVFNEENESVCWLDDKMKSLVDYPIKEGMRVHVTDPNLRSGEFDTNDESVPMFELPYEEYAKRDDSVLAFKRRNKFGQFKERDPEEEQLKKDAEDKRLEEEKNKANAIHVGDRCEIQVPNQPKKRGEVKYIGNSHFKTGLLIGVQYDEPSGKNNGSVDGKFYFKCPDKYGAFIKPQYVEVGDFPELGLDDLDEI